MIDGPLFTIFGKGVYPYGICMALGIIACFVFLMFTMTKKNFNDEAIDKMLIIGFGATAFGVFIAMVFQALYDYIEDPAGGFSLSGSMTFQGGLIGGVVSFLLVWNLFVFVIAPRANKSKSGMVVKIFGNNMNATLSDAIPFVPPAITIAHAFGRLGCTFAGCCHGAKTDAWYGIWMYTAEFGHAKVVPTQLFECIFLVVLSAVMIVLYFKFKFNYNFSVYLIAYGVWRFLIEFARDDHRGNFIGAVTPSQFWSIIMVILGVAFIFIQKYLLSKFMKHPENQPPVREPKKKAQAAGTVGEDKVDMSEFVPEERMAENEPAEDKTAENEPDNPDGAEAPGGENSSGRDTPDNE